MHRWWKKLCQGRQEEKSGNRARIDNEVGERKRDGSEKEEVKKDW